MRNLLKILKRAFIGANEAPATLLFLFFLFLGSCVLCSRLAIHTLVPNRWQRHAPFRQILKGGASEIGGTPQREGSFRAKTEWEFSQNFPFRISILESSSLWDRTIGWNIPPLDPWLSPFHVADGYLSRSSYRVQEYRRKDAEHVRMLADWLSKRNIPVLYVIPPSRLSHSDKLYNDVFDFSAEQNLSLSLFAKSNNIPVLDLSQKAETEHMDNHSMFYSTDHHFNVRTARWAAESIAERLVSLSVFDFDFNLLAQTNRWTDIPIDKSFLGSIGRKATKAWSTPETFFIPTTSLPHQFVFEHLGFTGTNTKEEGCFDVFFRRSHENFGGVYRGYRYETICRGSGRIVRIRNRTIPEAPKLLFVADSYDNAILPFIACVCSEVVSVDGRNGDVNVPELVANNHFDAAVILFSVPPDERYLSCFMASEDFAKR